MELFFPEKTLDDLSVSYKREGQQNSRGLMGRTRDQDWISFTCYLI